MTAAILFSFLLCALGVNTSAANLKKDLELEGVFLAGADKFEIKKNKQRIGKAVKFIEISADNELSNERIDIEISSPIDRDLALTMAKTQSEIIAASYDDQATPYAGELTNSASCDKKYKIKIHKGENKWAILHLIEARASPRYTWGYCKRANDGKRALISFYYVPESKKLIKITLFKNEMKFNIKQQVEFLRHVDFKNQ